MTLEYPVNGVLHHFGIECEAAVRQEVSLSRVVVNDPSHQYVVCTLKTDP
jgi:hypothetical protein